MDLQLDVRGCADVAASFAKLVAVEAMEGDNAYAADGFGLQPARKGVRFLRFPPVLQARRAVGLWGCGCVCRAPSQLPTQAPPPHPPSPVRCSCI